MGVYNLFRKAHIIVSGADLDLAPTGDLKFKGVVFSATELGALDGVSAGTVTASKAVVVGTNKNIDTIVIADGGLKLGSGAGTAVTATAAELNYNDVTAAGTAQASKAAILGANKNLDTLVIADSGLKLGSGAGTAIDATAAEINAAADVSASGVGAVSGTGVTVAESGNAVMHKTVFTFTNVDIALIDEAGIVAYKGLKIYDMPAGAIYFLGCISDLDVTKSSAGVNADWDGDFALGTVTASNNATLATTEQNILPTTATPQAVAGVTTANGQSTATENAIIDGTTTAVDVYINFLVDDADHDVTGTPCNLILNGTVTLLWTNLGDY